MGLYIFIFCCKGRVVAACGIEFKWYFTLFKFVADWLKDVPVALVVAEYYKSRNLILTAKARTLKETARATPIKRETSMLPVPGSM